MRKENRRKMSSEGDGEAALHVAKLKDELHRCTEERKAAELLPSARMRSEGIYCIVGFVCLSVCLSVCLLLSISLLGCLFVPETIPSTQRATRVRKYVGFSLKMIRCRARALYG